MILDLLFLPQHDPSFPHSGIAHLAGYIRSNADDIVVNCVDLNHKFFLEDVFGENGLHQLSKLRDQYNECRAVNDGLQTVKNFERLSSSLCHEWGKKNPGYKISLRTLDGPLDRTNTVKLEEYAASKGPFDRVFYEYLDASEANVIGVNLTVEDQLLPLFRFLKICRDLKPQVKIILGGALLSRVYPVLVQNFSELFDYIIIREGEKPLLKLLHSIRSGAEIADAKIIFSEQSVPSVDRNFTDDGELEVQDIDEVSCPDFSDFEPSEYWGLVPMLPILNSRKCYWGRCKFCTIHDSWDPLARKLDAQTCFQTIKRLVRETEVRDFRFVDEASPPDLLYDLAKLILDDGLKIQYEIYAIAEKRFLNPDFVSALGASGCRQVYFGLENVNADAAKLMGKSINQSGNMEQIFSLCEENNIHVYVYTLFGYPGVTTEQEQETVDFIASTKSVHTATIGSFVPVVGSPFAKDYRGKTQHNGGLTEDYFAVKLEGDEWIEGRKLGADAAQYALKELLKRRSDLALTTLLNDESRYALARKFGAQFARSINTIEEVDDIFDKATRERITRGN